MYIKNHYSSFKSCISITRIQITFSPRDSKLCESQIVRGQRLTLIPAMHGRFKCYASPLKLLHLTHISTARLVLVHHSIVSLESATAS